MRNLRNKVQLIGNACIDGKGKCRVYYVNARRFFPLDTISFGAIIKNGDYMVLKL